MLFLQPIEFFLIREDLFMGRSIRWAWGLALALLVFLGSTGPASSANIDLQPYLLGALGRWNRFTYTAPPSYPGFTLSLTRVTSGPFAGKYRLGDYLTPDPTKDQWFIFGPQPNAIYVYATDQGTFGTPIAMPRFVPLDTLVNHPFESGFYWYFKIIPSLTVPAGTFNNVLAWIVLDGSQPANAVNSQIGLPSSINYGVHEVDWSASQVGDLKSLEVDAATGNTIYAYQLTAYGVKRATPLYLLLD
jgi:hypothetical protein